MVNSVNSEGETYTWRESHPRVLKSSTSTLVDKS